MHQFLCKHSKIHLANCFKSLVFKCSSFVNEVLYEVCTILAFKSSTRLSEKFLPGESVLITVHNNRISGIA